MNGSSKAVSLRVIPYNLFGWNLQVYEKWQVGSLQCQVAFLLVLRQIQHENHFKMILYSPLKERTLFCKRSANWCHLYCCNPRSYWLLWGLIQPYMKIFEYSQGTPCIFQRLNKRTGMLLSITPIIATQTEEVLRPTPYTRQRIPISTQC